MRSIYLITIVTMIFASCSNRNDAVQIGKKVPNYTFTEILNSPDKKLSLADLKGKPVIIEFWATWCGACQPAMKKLDKIQSKYKNQIEIITVAADDRNKLEKYISLTNTKLKITNDTLAQNVFPVRIIPHTIIIDKNGIVCAITSPENLNDSIIDRLVSGLVIELPYKNDFKTDTSGVKILYQHTDSDKSITLTNYNPTRSSMFQSKQSINGNLNGLEFHNLYLPSIFETLFELPSFNWIVYSDELKDYDFYNDKKDAYNFEIEVSEALEENLNNIAIDFLNENTEINARLKTDTVECLILVKENNLLQKSSSDQFAYNSRGGFFAKKIKIKLLTGYLERYSDLPIVDKTELKDVYDIDLDWELDESKTISSELKKYGLKLKKSKLPIEVVEIFKK